MMNVNLRLMSILAVQAKVKPNELLSFELPEGATLADLLDAADARIGEHLPRQTWNRETKRFHSQVSLLVNGRRAEDPSFPLQDGNTVMAMVAIAGG